MVSRLVARQMKHAAPMKVLRKTKTKDHFYLLSAPATAALAIADSSIEWPEGRPLRLLLMSTHRDEYIDHGQWYRFVPAMLETDKPISVCACDVSGALRTSRVPHVLCDRAAIRTYMRSHTIAQELASAPCDFDIAMSFSPLQPTPQLLTDLQALRERGIPFYFTSSSSTHALLNHAMLSAFTATAETVVAVNPFSLVSVRMGENLNRVISVIRPENLPGADAKIDDEYLDCLVRPAEMVLNSHREGDPSQTWPVGAEVSTSLVHTMDGVAVNLSTKEVLDLNTDKVLGLLADEYCDFLDGYEGSWDEVDRLIWAGHVRFIAAATNIAPTAYQREKAA